MSLINRETIYAALFAKAQAATGFATVSRVLRQLDDVAPADTPALFQVQANQLASQARGLATRWQLTATWYVFVVTDPSPGAVDGGVVPAAQLNACCDACEAVLAPHPGTGVQDLGGVVQHCWIDGAIETDEGTFSTRAVAIIPISIIANL